MALKPWIKKTSRILIAKFLMGFMCFQPNRFLGPVESLFIYKATLVHFVVILQYPRECLGYAGA